MRSADGGVEQQDVVSVVVPVFNGRDHLGECLQSVVTQSYAALQILLVDDGSTDGSSQLCDEWARRDPRVRTVHTPNGGLSHARNTGIDAAEGDYLTFVDADDVVGPEHVAHMHRVARERGVDLVQVGFTPFGSSTPAPEFRAASRVSLMTPDEALLEAVTRGRGFSSWGKLFSASVFSQVRFRDGADFEDLEVYPRLLAQISTPVATSDAVSYGYRQHEASLMGGHRRVLRRSLLDVLESNIALAEEHPGRGVRVADPLVTGYVMHALRVLEQASDGGGVMREPGYDRQLRRLIGRRLGLVLRSEELHASYKAAVVTALISPDAFLAGYRGAKALKRSVAPHLRRRR